MIPLDKPLDGLSTIPDSQKIKLDSEQLKGTKVEDQDPNILTSKKMLPIFKSISRPLDIRNSESEMLDTTMTNINASRILSKAEISYGLMEYQSAKLAKISEEARKIQNPDEAKKYYSDSMIKNGYQNISVKIKDNSGESELEVWTKPDCNCLIHTCPFSLINSKVVKPMINKNLRDDQYILNNNKKMCVSILNTESGKMYQSESRAGIIVKVPPVSILDTYPADRSSPVGFTKTKEEIDLMSPEDVKKYESRLQLVDHFIVHLKKYRTLCNYTRNLGEGLICSILLENNKLSPHERMNLENFIAGLDKKMHNALINPKDNSFEDKPPLLEYLDQLINIYNQFGKDYEKAISKVIYGDETIEFGKQLLDLASFTKNMLNDTDAWEAVNIHPSAKNWEEAIRDLGEKFAKRLMTSGIHGPSALAIGAENNPRGYAEVNILTENIDLVGFIVSKSHFLDTDKKFPDYSIDEPEITNLIENMINPLSNKIALLREQKKGITPGSEEEKKIDTQINNLEKELKKYDWVKTRKELLALLKTCSENFVPIIVA